MWWHLADSNGVKIIKTTPDAFGDKLETEMHPAHFADKKTVRFWYEKDFVLNFIVSHPGGQLLVLDPLNLAASEYFPNPNNGHRIVLGSVAARKGNLQHVSTILPSIRLNPS